MDNKIEIIFIKKRNILRENVFTEYFVRTKALQKRFRNIRRIYLWKYIIMKFAGMDRRSDADLLLVWSWARHSGSPW